MTLFIDTNIILHFTPLDQVDWAEVCGEQKVNILFAPVVIEELDKQKRNSNSRISKRAKNAVKKIGEIGITGNWTDNISIQVITKRPASETYLNHSLNREEQDDRLLAAIIEFKATSDGKVKLITNDLGPKLKCLSLGVEAMSLPDKYELKEEDDDVIKENNKLKEQINKYKSGVPKLSLQFDNDESFIAIRLKRFDFSDFKSLKMSEIEREHPYMEVPKEDTLRWAFRHPFVNEESIKNYNLDLAKFYLEYETYLSECEAHFVKLNLTESIKFKLFNKGVIPAGDIDVKLHFPDGFSLKDRKPKNTAEKPRPPFKPGEALTLNPYIFSSIARPNIDALSFPAKGSPSIKKTNSYDVAFDLDTLKHNQEFIFEELFVTFDSFENAVGFKVDYKIFAANIPDVLTGQLNVIVEKE
jgi:hypothetical protein